MQKMKIRVEDGKLRDEEVLLIIFNSVFECCFYQAEFSIPDFHNITLQLHDAYMTKELLINVFHIAGTWIKHLCIYGLSREDLLEVVMAGSEPLQILPLKKLSTRKGATDIDMY